MFYTQNLTHQCLNHVIFSCSSFSSFFLFISVFPLTTYILILLKYVPSHEQTSWSQHLLPPAGLCIVTPASVHQRSCANRIIATNPIAPTSNLCRLVYCTVGIHDGDHLLLLMMMLFILLFMLLLLIGSCNNPPPRKKTTQKTHHHHQQHIGYSPAALPPVCSVPEATSLPHSYPNPHFKHVPLLMPSFFVYCYYFWFCFSFCSFSCSSSSFFSSFPFNLPCCFARTPPRPLPTLYTAAIL